MRHLLRIVLAFAVVPEVVNAANRTNDAASSRTEIPSPVSTWPQTSFHFRSALSERGMQGRSAFAEIGKVEPKVAAFIAACDQEGLSALIFQVRSTRQLR